MAPPGAGLSFLGCLLVWLLAARWACAEANETAPAGAQCRSLSDDFSAALGAGVRQPKVTLGPGCNILTRNFACLPIQIPLLLEGPEGSGSTWDTNFDLYQFSLEPGVVVTLQNMVLARALVFTSLDANLQPSTTDTRPNLQPSIFHMRPGSRLVLQNVTIRTRCTTLFHCWRNYQGYKQPQPAGDLSPTPPPMFFGNTTLGAVTLLNVTLSCGAGSELSTWVDLNVHTAPMLSAFLGAASALSISATVHLMENITLPRAPSSSLLSGSYSNREGAVVQDTVIVGSKDNLTYVDANFTGSWLTVQSPARLTLKRLVLTRLAPTTVVAPGGSSGGLLAGALPLSLVQVAGSPTQPLRIFEDVTLLVPQYEVREMTYWCIMFNVGTPEVKSVADFLRPYVWPSSFDVLGPSRLLLKRVRTVSSNFTHVQLTSEAPSGVPFDPTAGPPAAVAAYQHVTPPLYFVASGADWADAAAPVLPQDTWPSPLPAGGASGLGGSDATQLPALLLINGTVTLRPSDVRVPGGSMRVVRRSVVVTSMRQDCGPPSCPPAVLDLGGLINAMRLEGPNSTVVFVGITLRNAATTLNPETAAAAVANESIVGGFFNFDRSGVRVSFESVNVELRAEVFTSLFRFISLRPRSGSPGDVDLIAMNQSLIQLANFQFGGARGRYVNFTLVPGSGAGILTQPAGSGGSGSSTVAIAVGTVVGTVGLLLVVAVGFAVAARLRRRPVGEPGEGGAAAEAAAGKDASTARSAGADPSLEDSDKNGGSEFTAVTFGAATAAAGAAAAQLPSACERAKVSGDDDSPQCTTLTISDLNSSDGATPPLQAVAHLAAAASASVDATLAVASASEQMARRAFSLARSVPEDDELGADVSLDSTGTAGTGCSSSAGGFGRRLLQHAAAGGAVTAPTVSCGVRAVRRTPPSLLDPPADASGRGSVGGSSGGGGGSGASGRRMLRVASGGRTYLHGSGEGGRTAGLRVRAALGRSPSRPARSSANSSGNGPPTTLPAPQPALLMSPALHSAVTAPAAASGAPVSCSGVRVRGDRVAHVYQSQQHHVRNGGGAAGHRREASNMSLTGAPAVAAACGGGTVTAALGAVELVGGEATASHSAQLMGTGGTLEQLSCPNLDEDCSLGRSNSISKVPEPASEVQRLIQELSTHGTDQLVILEPIGQGGYGTVYRGVWRNLDVAVKTVLFQDRANLASPPQCCPMSVSVSAQAQACAAQNGLIVQTAVVEEDGEGSSHKGPGSRPGSSIIPGHPSPLMPPPPPHVLHATANGAAAAAAGGTFWGGAAVAAPSSGRDAHASGGGGNGTHNWALASQQAANSGSLPSVNVGAAAAAAAPAGGPLGPLGVASQQRAVLEAAVSCSVAHPNVVATYHYDITPIRPSGVACSGGLLVSDGCVRGPWAGPGGPGGPTAAMSDWKLYLVQEFCDAGSLANALDARAFHDPAGMPNLALTLCALADIARGMAHIHSRSIVHGDLNPTNILLRSVSGSNGGIVPMWNRVALGGGGGGGVGGCSGSTTPGGGGGGGCVGAAANLRYELGVTLVSKVADFGLCGMLTPGKRHISNAMRGTPFYTAPETVATGTLTKASDVYSFGVIAWEVYTGRPPFQHVPDRGFVRDESFPHLPPHVPASFAQMALACVSPDPEARPTFDQILDRLMSLQSKLAVSLQQRLSRLMASSAAFLGAASPQGPATAASTPLGAATPTQGYGGGGLPCGLVSGGGGQSVSKPPQSVCCAAVARGLVGTAALAGGGGSSPGLLSGGGGVPNFPLSTPCVLPIAATATAPSGRVAPASQRVLGEAGGR